MVLYTPKEKPMTLEEVQNAGYGVSVTPTRLVLRSPYNTPETCIEDVSERVRVCKVSVLVGILTFSLVGFLSPSTR